MVWPAPAWRTGHERALATVFGTVRVTRMTYRARQAVNLYPGDAVLHRPAGKHSHGLRRLAAVEAARGSFTDAATAIERATGTRIGKRQVEELTRAAGTDVEAFSAARRPEPAPSTDVLVAVRGRQGRGDAPRSRARGDRPGSPVPQAVDPSVQGRETRPETDG
jgi:hypothetical protein